MSDFTNNNILVSPKTAKFPDGTMGSLRAELGLMAGFIGAFILTFAVWCILFKYFSDRDDRERAELMARGMEMRSGVKHHKDVVGPTTVAEVDREDGVLGMERRVEGSRSGNKED
jgi:hypothetical protein